MCNDSSATNSLAPSIILRRWQVIVEGKENEEADGMCWMIKLIGEKEDDETERERDREREY